MEPGRDLNLRPGFRRVLCVPRSREREKTRGRKRKTANVQNKLIWYIVISLNRSFYPTASSTTPVAVCSDYFPRFSSVGNAYELSTFKLQAIIPADNTHRYSHDIFFVGNTVTYRW